MTQNYESLTQSSDQAKMLFKKRDIKFIEKTMQNKDFIWSPENPLRKKAHQIVSKEFMEINGVQGDWLAIVQDGSTFK